MAVSHTRRSNGEESPYPTAAGRWRGAVLVTDPLTGEMTDKYAPGRTRAEAARCPEQIRNDDAAGTFATGEYLKRWLGSARQRLRPLAYCESAHGSCRGGTTIP
jgi:hypothetical protein